MRILIVGGTGFVGRALVQTLLRDGHEITVWSRNPDAASQLLGPEVVCTGQSIGPELVAEKDAVINLAGAGIFDRRWSTERKRILVTSRVDLTERLVSAIQVSPSKPTCLLNASAVGVYGSRVDAPTTEEGAPGEDFLARLCVDWEHAANKASAPDLRVVILRLGIVLGLDGGALDQQLPFFKRGLGGRIGSGTQWFPWIHLDDAVAVILRCLEKESISGPVNVVAPMPVQNREWTKRLAVALDTSARFPVPAPALRIILGGASSAVLGGQRVVPQRLHEIGFKFRYRRVEDALAAIKAEWNSVAITPVRRKPEGARCVAHYALRQKTRFAEPISRLFPFFSRAENLSTITPRTVGFNILRVDPPEMREGTKIEYRIRLAGIPLFWRTLILRWKPGESFVDVQAKGPYRLWWHEHTFKEEAGASVMEDTVYYRLRFGVFGRLVHWLFVAPKLREIFGYRRGAMLRRFHEGA